MAWLALLTALAAIALASRPYWAPAEEEQGGPPAAAADVAAEVAALDGRIESMAERVDRLNAADDDVREALDAQVVGLEQALASQRDEAATLRDELASLRDELEQGLQDPEALDAMARRVGRLEGTQSSGEASLEARMASLEQRIEQRVAALQDQLGNLGADLEAVGQARARRLALVHARSLLVQGRDAWMLNGDDESARSSWARAASRLADLEGLMRSPDDPALMDAMDRLARAAERLQGPQVADRVASLDQLAAASADWPQAPVSDVDDSGGQAEPLDDDSPGTWRDRVAGAFGALVTVEAIDDAPPTPVELDRARTRIAASLNAAAIATARQDWATVSMLLEHAAVVIEGVLDANAGPVRDALERLGELGTAPEAPVLPAAYQQVLSAVESALERAE